MGIIVFCLAAILSLPKQFITVYLGVILEQSNSGAQTTQSRIISDVVLAVTIIITFIAMWYIFRLMDKVKPKVVYERRKAR
jgi:heme/copper-type cytochrome/quinol oxidase subunit 2